MNIYKIFEHEELGYQPVGYVAGVWVTSTLAFSVGIEDPSAIFVCSVCWPVILPTGIVFGTSFMVGKFIQKKINNE